jgi:hypothetical protein
MLTYLKMGEPMPECPVCDEEYGASGIHPHLRSHEKSELVSIVAQVARNSESTIDQPSTEDSVWHRIQIQRTEIDHQRKKRNQRVNQHLTDLNNQIKETLQ